MNRVPTHIEDLDRLLEGGIPEGSFVLISGPPGTMKTSLAYAILHENAVRGEKGLYVTMEQSRGSLVTQMGLLGYPIKKAGGNLCVLDLAGLRKRLPASAGPPMPWVDLLKFYARGLRTSFDYGLLALDSLDALEIAANFEDIRRDVFDLVRWFRNLGCTYFAIAEAPGDSPANSGPGGHGSRREEYLADGIFHLRRARQGEFGAQRQLQVAKMRGTRHSTSFHALLFENGFRLSPVLG